MKFSCRLADGEHVVVSEDDDGNVLAVSPPCGSKFQAMRVRDLARNAANPIPDGWNTPGVGGETSAGDAPAAVSHALAAFDHDGDGKPGGSLPKVKAKGGRRKGKPEHGEKTDTSDDEAADASDDETVA